MWRAIFFYWKNYRLYASFLWRYLNQEQIDRGQVVWPEQFCYWIDLSKPHLILYLKRHAKSMMTDGDK